MAITKNSIPARMNKDRPIYRVTEKSYIDDVFLEPETMPIDPETDQPKPLLIEFDGDPGYNLEPWNDLARKKWSSIHGEGSPKQIDPIREMTQVR